MSIKKQLYCDSADSLIQSKLDGKLSKVESGKLAEHLESCPECERLSAGYSRHFTAASVLPQRRVPADFTYRVLSRLMEEEKRRERSFLERLFQPEFGWSSGWMIPAAAAAVVVLLMAVTVNLHGQFDTGQMMTALIVPDQGSLVKVDSGGRPATVSEGIAVNLNDLLSVETGFGSKAEVTFQSGTAFEVGSGSACSFRDGQATLSRGTFVARIIDKLTTQMIETPGALLELIDSRIALKVLPGELTRVGVFSGQIIVHPIQGKSFALKEGQQFMVSPGGRVLALGNASNNWVDDIESDLL